MLFHHDPDRDDNGVDDLVAVAESRVAASERALRIIPAAEGEELLLAEGPYARTTDVEPAPERMPDRARILVADDDVALVRILEAVLRGDGYDVDVAFDGEEMLSKAAASAYDLVLVDIVMPNLDGLAACKRLRSLEGYRDTPFVVLTARTRQDDMAAAFDAGITDYIRKPFACRRCAREYARGLRAAQPAGCEPEGAPRPYIRRTARKGGRNLCLS